MRSLEEAKTNLQHSDIPLKEKFEACTELLEQVSSLKRRVTNLLKEKLPPITESLSKKEAGLILSQTRWVICPSLCAMLTSLLYSTVNYQCSRNEKKKIVGIGYVVHVYYL